MSLDQRSLLLEQTDFPAECVGFHVYLHVMLDTLQHVVKSHSWADLASGGELQTTTEC